MQTLIAGQVNNVTLPPGGGTPNMGWIVQTLGGIPVACAASGCGAGANGWGVSVVGGVNNGSQPTTFQVSVPAGFAPGTYNLIFDNNIPFVAGQTAASPVTAVNVVAASGPPAVAPPTVTHGPPSPDPVISWGASAGADSYQVQQASSAAGPFAPTQIVTNTQAAIRSDSQTYVQIVPLAAGIPGPASAPPVLVAAKKFSQLGYPRHARIRR